MASRWLLILFLPLLIVMASECLAIDINKGSKEPIVITSKSLSADNKEKIATFEGSVVVKRGDVFLYADKMKIYYGGQDDKNNISKIEAEGGVRLVRNKSILTAKTALYIVEPEETVIFTGEPRATDGNNVITGSKITYFIKHDRSVVEESRVVITNQGKEDRNR